jgi:hypothetical protein
MRGGIHGGYCRVCERPWGFVQNCPRLMGRPPDLPECSNGPFRETGTKLQSRLALSKARISKTKAYCHAVQPISSTLSLMKYTSSFLS